MYVYIYIYIYIYIYQLIGRQNNNADDTKVFRKVSTDYDKQHLQNDLDK